MTAPFIDQISAATADFSANVTDPKASIITTYNFLLGQVCAGRWAGNSVTDGRIVSARYFPTAFL